MLDVFDKLRFFLFCVIILLNMGASEVLMPIKIKAIIFDCDGILVNSESAHFLTWKQACALEGHELSEHEYDNYIGKSGLLTAKLISENIPGSSAERILYNKRIFYHEIQKNGIPPIDHVVEFLHRLVKFKDQYNLKLGVASAAPKDQILMNLKNLAIEHYFDAIISGVDDLLHINDSEGVNKPKPYIYQHIAHVLKVPPKECVVFEDSITGVVASIKAGCVTVAVPNRFTKDQEFSIADLVLESLDEYSLENLLEKIGSLQLK